MSETRSLLPTRIRLGLGPDAFGGPTSRTWGLVRPFCPALWRWLSAIAAPSGTFSPSWSHFVDGEQAPCCTAGFLPLSLFLPVIGAGGGGGPRAAAGLGSRDRTD